MKLTEDKIVLLLCRHLEGNGWVIKHKKLGFTHGIDIEAVMGNEILAIEAKGAMANIGAHNKKREYFDGGQIKTHFGKALLKVLELKTENPDWVVGIAQPDDELIRKHTKKFIPFLQQLKIRHYWVSEDGKVIEE